MTKTWARAATGGHRCRYCRRDIPKGDVMLLLVWPNGSGSHSNHSVRCQACGENLIREAAPEVVGVPVPMPALKVPPDFVAVAQLKRTAGLDVRMRQTGDAGE